MSELTYKLSYIKYAKNLKTICIERDKKQYQYILNIQKNDDQFDKNNYTSNIACLSIDNTLYHNMYSTAKTFYKSALYNRPQSQRDNTTYDYSNIFSRNITESLTTITKVDDIMFSYIPLSPNGHIDIEVDSYSFISIDNGYFLDKLPDYEISTCLYNRNNLKNLIDAYRNNLQYDPNSIIDKHILGINYNMIFEIPGNIQNDFDSGNTAANSILGKNQYNSLYTMSHTENQYDLLNCREYVDIDSCNTQLYLKYYDNINYSMTEIDNKYLSASIERSQKSKYNTHIQHIETIANINRYTNSNARKTNLYSLKLDMEVLNNPYKYKLSLSEDERKILKSNIKTNIRNIVSKMTPAQTQLFEIYM